MRATERRRLIERMLTTDGQVRVEDLADSLAVTMSTIRRDLHQLTVEGKITRTYGGAVMSAAAPAEPTLHQRSSLARREKDAIAAWAATQILDGETIMLDAGTTAGRVAHHLRRRRGLTVITNGLTSLIELADAEGIEVIALAGTMRHISQGFVGPLTELTLSRLTADRVFLGADGLVADRGICEASHVQTRCKETMAARARDVYVLAHNEKIGHAPFDAWAPLVAPWTLVTDTGTTEEQLAPFRRTAEVSVVVVAPQGPGKRSPG
jgi:DeoR/GlpR family transcriptional regulator of sugar metabolism